MRKTIRKMAPKHRMPVQQRKVKDNRPLPGYSLPKKTALRTYLVGNQYTRIHVQASTKRQAIAYYRKRIEELRNGLESGGFSTYGIPEINPQECVLLR